MGPANIRARSTPTNEESATSPSTFASAVDVRSTALEPTAIFDSGPTAWTVPGMIGSNDACYSRVLLRMAS